MWIKNFEINEILYFDDKLAYNSPCISISEKNYFILLKKEKKLVMNNVTVTNLPTQLFL